MLLQVFLKQHLSNVVFDSNFNDEGLCFFSFLYVLCLIFIMSLEGGAMVMHVDDLSQSATTFFSSK